MGTFRLALHEAWQAQATGLWGASGSGKSTFLEILLGLRRGGALRGHVKLNGRVLFDSTAKIAVPVAARDFAWAPQDQALFPHLTVAENILFAYSPARPPGGRVTPAEVIAILALGDLLPRLPGALSGGERQRVVLARAVLSQRRVLLLDEPLSSVDYDLKAAALNYMRSIREEFGLGMIYVSHDRSELNTLCDKILSL